MPNELSPDQELPLPPGAEEHSFEGVLDTTADAPVPYPVRPFTYYSIDLEAARTGETDYWQQLLNPEKETYVSGIVTADHQLVWSNDVPTHSVLAAVTGMGRTAQLQAEWDKRSDPAQICNILIAFAEHDETASQDMITLLRTHVHHPNMQLTIVPIDANQAPQLDRMRIEPLEASDTQ